VFIIMGATGNVGGAVAETLLRKGEPIAVVTRSLANADPWRAKGAEVLVADIHDVSSLRAAFRKGRRAFLLNPSADPTGTSDRTERETIRNILSALDGSGLEKVVAASTYGARSGEPAGDLTTLWHLEQGLLQQAIPAAINRGAYYMTNWLGMVDMVKKSGKLPSMFPADRAMPMVAPLDLGEAAAERLLSQVTDTEAWHVEGPSRYTAQDVAQAFCATLGKQVELDVAPRETWGNIFKEMGFSASAAKSYERMTAVTLDERFDKIGSVHRGRISLTEFVADSIG
jgi:uncharacterized protein YbjT (DUF2867 family)